jgi:hypothetical protein
MNSLSKYALIFYPGSLLSSLNRNHICKTATISPLPPLLLSTILTPVISYEKGIFEEMVSRTNNSHA